MEFKPSIELPALNGRRALITGITGQDGSYLAELLLQKGYVVWGSVRRSSVSNTRNIDHLLADERLKDRLFLEAADLADSASLVRLLLIARPDEVYNLAAQSHVRLSFDIPENTADVTGTGVVRLLESMRSLRIDARFYQASSSELYGRAKEIPQNECTPFHPRSPYACAKAFGFEITRNYRESYGIFAVNGILFNHESPRRGEQFVTRKISRAAAAIAMGLQSQLTLGNLDAKRDWGFAGDYVRAMWLMLQVDSPLDLVIASNETHSVREFCTLAFSTVGLPLRWEGSGVEEVGKDVEGRILVKIDPSFFRPAEVDLLLGDPTLAHKHIGWKPDVCFDELVKMMVNADLAAARMVAE